MGRYPETHHQDHQVKQEPQDSLDGPESNGGKRGNLMLLTISSASNTIRIARPCR
jgi:hypothetical protein